MSYSQSKCDWPWIWQQANVKCKYAIQEIISAYGTLFAIVIFALSVIILYHHLRDIHSLNVHDLLLDLYYGPRLNWNISIEIAYSTSICVPWCQLTRQTWLPASEQDWTIATHCSLASQKRTAIDFSEYLLGWSLTYWHSSCSSAWSHQASSCPAPLGNPSEQERHSRSPQWYSRSDGHIKHHICWRWLMKTSHSGHSDPHPSYNLRNRRFKQWMVVVRSNMQLLRDETVFRKQQGWQKL